MKAIEADAVIKEFYWTMRWLNIKHFVDNSEIHIQFNDKMMMDRTPVQCMIKWAKAFKIFSKDLY